jgi:hypothetical protein
MELKDRNIFKVKNQEKWRKLNWRQAMWHHLGLTLINQQSIVAHI